MAVLLTINGVTYNYPELTDEGWGPDATNWAVAITQGVLTKAGGLFSLTSDADFGPNFGLKSVYYKTRSANIASAGQFRLSNSDVISFRNAGNTANLNFGPGSSDAIPQWNSIDLVNLSTAQTLTNKTIVSGVFTGGTFNSPTINTPTVTGGTFSAPSFTNPTSTGGTFTTPTLVSPTITGTATFVNITTTGNTVIGDADTDTLAINADIITNLRPDVTATYDIGSSTNRWRDIFVSRDAYLGRSLHGDGLIATPGISFESEPGLGFYRPSAGVLNTVTTGGIVVTQHFSDRFRSQKQIVVEDGSVSAPSYSFENDRDTGLYIPSVNNLNIATGGIAAISINNSQQSTFAGNTYHNAGTVSLPGIAYAGDTDTGFYLLASNTIGIASGGQSAAQISLTLARFLGQIGAVDGNSAAPGYAFSSDLSSGLSLSGSSLRASVLGSIVWSAETTQISPRLPMRSFAAAGTSAAPNYSFNSDPDTGIYNTSANVLGFSTNATPRLLISDTAVETQTGVSYRGPNGTSSVPTYAFSTENDTGFYIPVATQIGISIGGNPKGAFRNDGFNYTNYYASTDGAANSAVYGFLSDTDTGMYRIGSDNLGFTAGGILRLSIDSSNIVAKQPILGSNGSASAPTYSWESETNSGFYRLSASDIGLSVGGSLKAHWTGVEMDILQPIRIFGGLGLVLNNAANTFSTTIRAGSNAADYTITLPAAAPAANTFLKYNGADYIWSAEAGVGDINNGGNTFGIPIVIGTNDAFDLSFETNNVTRLTINQSDQLLAKNGSLTNPSYSFISETNTGMYLSAATVMTAAVTGNTVMSWYSNRVRPLRPLASEDGTSAAPSYTFENDLDTGMYRIGTNQIGFATGGAFVLSVGGTDSQLQALDGSTLAPTYSFLSEPTTGFYLQSAGVLSSVVGTAVISQSISDRFRVLRQLVAEDGTAAAPSYSFENDRDNGMYRIGTNQIGFAAGGVLKLSIDTSLISATQQLLGTGSVAAPAFAFVSDTDTGIYNVSDGILGIASNGASMAQFSATLARFLAPIGSIDGNSAAPGIAFTSDVSTGFSLSGTVLSASVSGGYTTRFESNKITLHNPTANSDYNIVRNFNTGSITISGGTSDTTGGAIKLYGSTSAGNPDEIVLRNSAGQTALFSNDNQLYLGNSSLATSRMTLMAAASTGAGIIRMNSDDQNLTVTGGNADTTGASVILYGNNSGSNPAYTLFTNNNISTGHISTTGAWRIGAVAGTQAHAVNGSLSITGQVIGQNGLVSAPSYSFTSDLDTGMYWIAAGRLGFAANSVNAFEINDSYIRANLPVFVENGSAAAPSYSFLNDQTSGFYRIGSNNIGLSVAGTLKADWGTTQNINYQPVKITAGQSLILNNTANTFFVGLNAEPTAASYTITLPAAAPGSNTVLTYNGTNYVWNAAGSPVVTPATLTDNTTDGTVTTFVSATTNAVFVKYSLKRGTNFQTGELKIVNDGTTPLIVDANVPLGDCGTSFTVDISGANLRLLYTTTSTGTNVDMKYTVESWQA